eukprot:CAMPEP_0183744310 /NCGR_PEP_ID=MMETSP0737-20130205/65664_1 /TAXON_ID=385413 /ORGANISM="Thalassiosira miniscula, Strain CCMP1093" /LENGTH=710 /DNA_ID=CAMNT_0025979949 /DNA_START=316 /DNA_END=2448 /DNA_ORIENTATION=+
MNSKNAAVAISDSAANVNVVPQAQASVSTPDRQTQTFVDLIFDITGNKPLDASDVSDLASAKNQIEIIRTIATEYLDNVEGIIDQEVKDDRNDPRGAFYDKQDFSSFRKVSYEKTDDIRSLIYHAIRTNELFEHDTKDEILQLIDLFKPQSFRSGEIVISQGDEGSEFYVVESGVLSVQIAVEGEDRKSSNVKVNEYSTGATFGEMALILGSPRAATIAAMTDCKLWSIERAVYRSAIYQSRYEEHIEKTAFLEACVVAGRKFSDIFSSTQIDDLAIATKVDIYEEGQVILCEGEIGDTFYIVKSGSVHQSNNACEKMIEKQAVFGTTSLLKGVPSSLTYRAASHVALYALTRKDFEEIMGSFQDALDGNTVARHTLKLDSSVVTTKRYKLGLNDLNFYNILGQGAFGKVTLVADKRGKKVFALKSQSKHHIIKKKQQEHVLNEYRILMNLDHPNILGIHCAIQDKKHLHFLLDLLPGGDLMSYLKPHIRAGGGFTEDVTRFYAATVLLAFEHLHTFQIAYRDLKPENIVLNKRGYGVLVDFGLAKEIEKGQSFTACGTPDYLAPEIICGKGHDWAVDYWGLGIFLFEMTNGSAPFYDRNRERRYRKIMMGLDVVKMPSFSGGLIDLIEKLLVLDPSKRLGRSAAGVNGIFNHRWFAGFDWDGFREQSIEAKIVPRIPDPPKPDSLNHHLIFEESTHAMESDWWPDLEQW